ncbi:MAG: ZIP family metal transporter [Halobacteriales archaeon]
MADESAAGTRARDRAPDRPLGLPRWAGALIPLVLLALLLGVLLVGHPFAGIQSGAPLPDVTVSHATLPDDETVVLHVTNNGPAPVTVSQVLVNEAYWNFELTSGGEPVRTLGPAQSARLTIPYHWTAGWDLEVALVLADGATVHHTIVAPAVSPGMTLDVLGLLAVIGVMVGVIPVALGMLWFPFMRGLGDRWLHAVLLFAAGVLAFLAFDAGFEAFEVAESVPGAYGGPLLVVLGVVGAALLVQAVAARGTAGDEPAPVTVAYLVALGIGLHNLAEGLAIGSAFALGRVSLGAFLVIGFMVHNVTEGPAVVAPIAREERPSLWHFVALGAVAGAPVVLGGWIGGLAFSPTLGALFLAIGVGAIVQVDWEIARMVRARGRLGTATNLLGFLVGFAVMYATDLLVAL